MAQREGHSSKPYLRREASQAAYAGPSPSGSKSYIPKSNLPSALQGNKPSQGQGYPGTGSKQGPGRPSYNPSAARGSAPAQKFTYQTKVQRGAGHGHGTSGSAVSRNFSNGKPYFVRNGD